MLLLLLVVRIVTLAIRTITIILGAGTAIVPPSVPPATVTAPTAAAIASRNDYNKRPSASLLNREQDLPERAKPFRQLLAKLAIALASAAKGSARTKMTHCQATKLQ
uniref:Putative secreted protein n=1 Tax=Anopheles marajoara TaxID=58244 RepID=A0A2M4C8A6_9DIPT